MRVQKEKNETIVTNVKIRKSLKKNETILNEQ